MSPKIIETDIVIAQGNKLVKGTHKSTFELTKEDYLTPRGDCIIAIKANKGVSSLSPSIKNLLRKNSTKVYILLVTDKGSFDIVKAQGSEKLKLTSNISLVIRKSSYIDGRTLAIKANKAAKDLNRELINDLRNPNTKLIVIIVAIQN